MDLPPTGRLAVRYNATRAGKPDLEQGQNLPAIFAIRCAHIPAGFGPYIPERAAFDSDGIQLRECADERLVDLTVQWLFA